MLIIGPTGSGKSVHGNTLVALEQKYGGFIYIFGPRVNPFALEPTDGNIKSCTRS